MEQQQPNICLFREISLFYSNVLNKYLSYKVNVQIVVKYAYSMPELHTDIVPKLTCIPIKDQAFYFLIGMGLEEALGSLFFTTILILPLSMRLRA